MATAVNPLPQIEKINHEIEKNEHYADAKKPPGVKSGVSFAIYYYNIHTKFTNTKIEKNGHYIEKSRYGE